MGKTIEQFVLDCKKIPGDSRHFTAYTDLRKKIEDMEELLPLIEMLTAPSIRERHWEEIIGLCGR